MRSEISSPEREEASMRGHRIRSILAAVWAVFVVLMYAQRQLALHWPAVQEQIVKPLLSRGMR
jgi:hypothetical protein